MAHMHHVAMWTRQKPQMLLILILGFFVSPFFCVCPHPAFQNSPTSSFALLNQLTQTIFTPLFLETLHNPLNPYRGEDVRDMG